MTEYTPPSIWTMDSESGGKFANINRPESGPTHQAELPVGKHPFQLYSMATPNGVKIAIMFEELLAAGHTKAEYDAWLIHIAEGSQFGSGFVAVNPNSKIPALLDNSTPTPTRIFESGSILLYLAEKFGSFLPEKGPARTEVMNWLFWQMGSAPYLGGGFGHFYAYAPIKIKYCIDRFTMETKRQLDVLDKQLERSQFLAGDSYTIADIAVWPWYGVLAAGKLYAAGEFIGAKSYKHVLRWTNEIAQREPVRRGCLVNCVWGPENKQMRERHSAEDFVGKDLSWTGA